MQKIVKMSMKGKKRPGNGHNDRLIMLFKTKLTTVFILTLPWGYKHVYDHHNLASLLVLYTCLYLRSQVSVYRTICPLVSYFCSNT